MVLRPNGLLEPTHSSKHTHLLRYTHSLKERMCWFKGPFGRKRTKDLIFNNSCQSHVEFLRICRHICSSLHMCSGTHIRSRQMCWSHALIRTRNNCRADFQEFSPVARCVFKNVYTHLLQYTYLLKCTHLLKYTHYSPFPRR